MFSSLSTRSHQGAAFYLDAITASALLVAVVMMVILSFLHKDEASHLLSAALPLTGLFVGLAVCVGCCAASDHHR